jgi:hypothetical protein
MRKVIGGLCCSIVALQVLVAVPLAVCCAFFFCVAEGGAPIVLEIHSGPRPPATIAPADYAVPEPLAVNGPAPAIAPPRNIIPEEKPQPDHPIVATRQSQGSPLAGTVLETGAPPCEEQQLFLAALEKAALDSGQQQLSERPAGEQMCLGTPCAESNPASTSEQPERKETVQQLQSHLYEMANLDERAGQYDRADQWRALARDLRCHEDEPLD